MIDALGNIRESIVHSILLQLNCRRIRTERKTKRDKIRGETDQERNINTLLLCEKARRKETTGKTKT
jgi:hypothetical protein